MLRIGPVGDCSVDWATYFSGVSTQDNAIPVPDADARKVALKDQLGALVPWASLSSRTVEIAPYDGVCDLDVK